MIGAAVFCLALNIYYEARNQPVVGQIAVSQVVLHRVKDKRYPNTVCKVVRQAKYSEVVQYLLDINVNLVGFVMVNQIGH